MLVLTPVSAGPVPAADEIEALGESAAAPDVVDEAACPDDG
jgi:hypothetical protein